MKPIPTPRFSKREPGFFVFRGPQVDLLEKEIWNVKTAQKGSLYSL